MKKTKRDYFKIEEDDLIRSMQRKIENVVSDENFISNYSQDDYSIDYDPTDFGDDEDLYEYEEEEDRRITIMNNVFNIIIVVFAAVLFGSLFFKCFYELHTTLESKVVIESDKLPEELVNEKGE